MTKPSSPHSATPIMKVVPVPLRSALTGPEGEANRVSARNVGYEPRTNCFIATLPRSGSWLLSEALFNTGLVGEAHEYFRADFTALWAAEWGLSESVSYSEFVSAAKRMTATANDVFSAKLHWYQFSWLRERAAADPAARGRTAADVIGDWFPDLRFIFLWRRDIARQAISYYRAEHTQVWFQKEGSPSPVLLPDQVDFQQVRWYEAVLEKHLASWRAYFAQTSTVPFEVTYEDFVSHYEETVAQIMDYLSVAARSRVRLPPPGLQRQSDQQTDALLRRYLKIRNCLRGPTPGLYWCPAARKFRLPRPDTGD